MSRVGIAVASLLVGLLAAEPTGADPAKAPRAEDSARFMRVYGSAHPPYGFVQFCEVSPQECAVGPSQERRVEATPERLSELDDINRVVNRAIAPATDLELYGVTEHWTLPVDRGDCEDYALLKRHVLIKHGWPIGSVLMTVVRDEKGEGHAVLTARTTLGDYVLDNKVEDVRLWSRTGYRFVMRQSFLSPRTWVSLDPKDVPSPAAIAGVKSLR